LRKARRVNSLVLEFALMLRIEADSKKKSEVDLVTKNIKKECV